MNESGGRPEARVVCVKLSDGEEVQVQTKSLAAYAAKKRARARLGRAYVEEAESEVAASGMWREYVRLMRGLVRRCEEIAEAVEAAATGGSPHAHGATRRLPG